jgi:hypothetical protein
MIDTELEPVADKYGNRQMFPSPTALPAAARTKPTVPEKLPLFFSSIIYSYQNSIIWLV